MGLSKSLRTALVPPNSNASIEVRVSIPSRDILVSVTIIEKPDSTAVYSEIVPKKFAVSVPEPPSIVSLPEPPSIVSSPLPVFKISLPSLPVIRAESLSAIYDEIPLLLS